jgi:hypothetical protein
MKEYKLCLLVVWYEPAKTNLTTTLAVEQKERRQVP